MIYFYDAQVAKTIEIIQEACDCIDIYNDLNRIKQAITNIKTYGNWSPADHLNRELRQKYPTINNMIEFANSVSLQKPRAKKICSASEAVLSSLEQDYFGILCDTAIKKQVVSSIKDFVKNVD